YQILIISDIDRLLDRRGQIERWAARRIVIVWLVFEAEHFLHVGGSKTLWHIVQFLQALGLLEIIDDLVDLLPIGLCDDFPGLVDNRAIFNPLILVQNRVQSLVLAPLGYGEGTPRTRDRQDRDTGQRQENDRITLDPGQ